MKRRAAAVAPSPGTAADGKQVPVPGRTVRGAKPLETTCRERIGESGFNK